MTKYTDTHKGWEAEQREEIVKESIATLRYFKDRLSLLKKTPNQNSICKKSLARYYNRRIAREEAFLASEGVAF